MSIPLATTTITVKIGFEEEPGEGRNLETVVEGVRAVIGSPSGAELYRPGGGSSRITHVLNCDPCPGLVDNTYQVVDELTHAEYEVEWVQHRNGLGLDHTRAGLISRVGRPA